MPEFDPRVDAYIQKSKPFAQPILEYVRELTHAAVPGVEEAVKWSMPFFVYRGIILANMAAFKEHASFGLWQQNMHPLMKEGVAERGGGMGSFGKLTSIKDLPAKSVLKKVLVEAAQKIENGERSKNWERPVAAKKPAPKATDLPEALVAALKKSKPASARFTAMSPSCQREYAQWIGEAKQEATRDKRLAQAMEWITEGKTRNWKYQSK